MPYKTNIIPGNQSPKRPSSRWRGGVFSRGYSYETLRFPLTSLSQEILRPESQETMSKQDGTKIYSTGVALPAIDSLLEYRRAACFRPTAAENGQPMVGSVRAPLRSMAPLAYAPLTGRAGFTAHRSRGFGTYMRKAKKNEEEEKTKTRPIPLTILYPMRMLYRSKAQVTTAGKGLVHSSY